MKNNYKIWSRLHSTDSDFVNTALILDLLTMIPVRNILVSLINDYEIQIIEVYNALERSALEGGSWPRVIESREPSLAATISAVFSLRNSNFDLRMHHIINKADEFIVQQIRSKDCGHLLQIDNWMILARYCQMKAAQEHDEISEAERFDIISSFEGIQHKSLISRLFIYLRSDAPKESDRTAIFILTKGLPNEFYIFLIRCGRLLIGNYLVMWKAIRYIGKSVTFLLSKD